MILRWIPREALQGQRVQLGREEVECAGGLETIAAEKEKDFLGSK